MRAERGKSKRQALLDAVCKSRDLPALTVGAPCEVDNRQGIIVGGNNVDNLDVLFDDRSYISNCDPGVMMRIFNRFGDVQHESDDMHQQLSAKPPHADDPEIREVYRAAYSLRYGRKPIETAITRARLAHIVRQLGKAEARGLVKFYLELDRYLYRKHPVKQLLDEIDQIRGEMKISLLGR